MPDWKTLNIDATWVSGIVNCREYWMKACTSPRLICPDATRSPPSTAMTTKLRFPSRNMSGWMMPDTNWAPKLALKSFSLSVRNRASTSGAWPKAFTMACPVMASSTRALSEPVWVHWATNRFFDCRATSFTMSNDAGIVISATSDRIGEMRNIIVTTPMRVRVDVSIWLSVCWRLWAMLSMSFVTRLRRSPRGVRST